MKTDLLLPTPAFKLYRDKAIWVGTFIGGPLVAGYLLAMNFRQLGQERNAARSWVYSIGFTMILFALVILIPGMENIRSPLIPLLNTATASFLYKLFQARQVVSHIRSGGPIYPIRRAFLTGIVGLLIMLSIALLIVFVKYN